MHLVLKYVTLVHNTRQGHREQILTHLRWTLHGLWWNSARWESLHPCVRTPAFALNLWITERYYRNFHVVSCTKSLLKCHDRKNIWKISGSMLLGCCKNENTAFLGCLYGAFIPLDPYIAKHHIPRLWQSLFYLSYRFLSQNRCQMTVHSELMATNLSISCLESFIHGINDVILFSPYLLQLQTDSEKPGVQD